VWVNMISVFLNLQTQTNDFLLATELASALPLPRPRVFIPNAVSASPAVPSESSLPAAPSTSALAALEAVTSVFLVNIHVYGRVCVCVRTCVCGRVCIRGSTFVCVCVCMSMCMCMFTCSRV
jgi:hypothetical protein